MDEHDYCMPIYSSKLPWYIDLVGDHRAVFIRSAGIGVLVICQVLTCLINIEGPLIVYWRFNLGIRCHIRETIVTLWE